jgi:chromate transporter
VNSVRLGDIARLFLRLGFTAFGGPAAHVAMMQREVVERRGWITRERFVEMLGLVNLIPGPNSTELAIELGAELGGRAGLLVAGACFIGPAFLIVLGIAALYAAYGARPDLAAALAGMKPAAVAVVAHVVYKLAGSYVRRPFFLLLMVVVLAASLLGVHQLLLLLLAGAAGIFFERRRSSGDGNASPRRSLRSFRRSLFGLVASSSMLGAFAAPGIGSIFLYFLYIGSVLYGSGYVLIAFLQHDLVESLGWLTRRELLDAIAIGQVTPGPVFTTATFVGYLLGGVGGGIVGTLGIFLPSFLFILLLRRILPHLRSYTWFGGFLEGVNVAAVALIVAALIDLGGGALVDPLTWGIALVSFVILLTTKLNPSWLFLAGAIVAWLAR